MTSRHERVDDNDVMDLVDENDHVIGQINQADATTLLDTKAGYIRGTVAFIQNTEGQIWTPLRRPDKRIAPNGLDFSVAEHVQSGESYEDGVIRGFKEELFMDVDRERLKFLGRLAPLPQLPYFFCGVFLYAANQVEQYNTADFTSAEWLQPKDIIRRINEGTVSKDALKPALETFLIGA